MISVNKEWPLVLSEKESTRLHTTLTQDDVFWSGEFVECDTETTVDVSEHKGKKE